MAAINFFDCFARDVANMVHDLLGTDDTLRVYLSNVAPNAATMTVKADLAEISTGNGYAGAIDIENDGTASGGVVTVTAVDKTVTATGPVGPFRYVVLFNDTPAGDPLIAWWDYGSAVTLADGEPLDIDFGAVLLRYVQQAIP
jgi:hypothetical protein